MKILQRAFRLCLSSCFLFSLVSSFWAYSARAAPAMDVRLDGAKVSLPFTPLRINDSHILFSDYATLNDLNLDENVVRPVKVRLASGESIPLHPTGLASLGDGRVALANYSKRNVLIGKYDPENRIFVVELELTDPRMIGAEGVAAFGSRLFVADHDANLVFAFDVTDNAKPIWATPISIPHGISVSPEGRLFATSMVHRTISELSTTDGTILKVIGKIGAAKDDDSFLWPACVLATGQGGIVVTDGHSGYVKRLDFDSEKVERVIGGNGLGSKFFHNPGCMTPMGWSKAMMISAYQLRFVVFDTQSLDIESDRVIGLNSRAVYRDFSTATPFIEGWTINAPGWGYQSDKSVEVMGVKYRLGYARLIPEGLAQSPYQSAYPVLTFSEASPFSSISGYTYLLDHVKMGESECIFSPASGPIYCYSSDAIPSVVSLRTGGDRWVVDGAIRSSLHSWVIDRALVETAIQEMRGTDVDGVLGVLQKVNGLAADYYSSYQKEHALPLSNSPDLEPLKAALRNGDTKAAEARVCDAVADRQIEFTDALILSRIFQQSVLEIAAGCHTSSSRQDG